MSYESLDICIYVSIVIDQVNKSCVVTINYYDTMVDLSLLHMVGFEAIHGFNWLSQCHDILDCHTKTATLVMSGLARLE